MAISKIDLHDVVQANNETLERNLRAQNAAALVEAYYAEDAIVLPPDQPVASGRGPIREFWQGMFQAGLRDAALETTRIEASGDLACEIGKYTMTIAPPGAAPIQALGKYVVVLRRQPNGAWQTIVDMYSGNG